MLRIVSCITLLISITAAALVISSASTNLAIAADDPTEILNQEAQEGFVPLFDGKTLNGWIGNYKNIKAKDGMIVIDKDCGGIFQTEKEYGDFVLRFDFRLYPGSNSGLGIRAPKGVGDSRNCMELQILDNSAEKYANLKEYQYHGSLYFCAPAKRGALKKVGEWNSQEVSCIGTKLKVTLNGQVILDVDLADFDPEKTLSGTPVPGLRHPKGHIGFLSHHDPLDIRNIRIKEVKQSEKEEKKEEATK